jgi:hypothetical protein
MISTCLRSETNPLTLRADSNCNAARTLDQFSSAVRTAIVHVISTTHTKGALKAADKRLPCIGQFNRALFTRTTHL